MVKWLLFDIGNVVVNHIFERKDYYSFKGHKFQSKALESIYHTKAYKEFAKGRLSERELVRDFLNHSGLNLSVEDFIQMYQKDIRLIPGMKPLLRNLKETYPLAVLSNEGHEWTNRKINSKNLRDLFIKIITSADLGILKPKHEFYVQSLKILDARPEECLFIDDQEKNCDGARKAGIQAIQFSSTQQLKKELSSLEILLN